MVQYHLSVYSYCHDGGDPTPYDDTVDQALEGAKELVKAGYDALHDSDAKTFKPIFERYFGTLAKSKRERVRCTIPLPCLGELFLVCSLAVFRKMMNLVENDKDVDVVIHVGTDHLSDDTAVYVKAKAYKQKLGVSSTYQYKELSTTRTITT